MDQTARDEKINQLLRMQAELNAQLQQLGIKPGDSREQKAPDGGAISNAHQFMSPRMLKTVRVRFKDVPDCDEAIIRADQFDEAKHELLDTPRTPRAIRANGVAPGAGAKKRGFTPGAQTRDELLTMTIPALRLLPEVRNGMKEDDIPDKKAELVDAILRVREEAGALTE